MTPPSRVLPDGGKDSQKDEPFFSSSSFNFLILFFVARHVQLKGIFERTSREPQSVWLSSDFQKQNEPI